MRNAVYKNKKKVKGKRFLITESLTENRVKALKATQQNMELQTSGPAMVEFFINVIIKYTKFNCVARHTLWKKLAFEERVSIVVYLVFM